MFQALCNYIDQLSNAEFLFWLVMGVWVWLMGEEIGKVAKRSSGSSSKFDDSGSNKSLY